MFNLWSIAQSLTITQKLSVWPIVEWLNKTLLLKIIQFYNIFKGNSTKRPDYVKVPNGCGAYDLNIDFNKFGIIEFNNCCDKHDICYSDCYGTKKSCDTLFESCLVQQCNKLTTQQNWSFLKILGNRVFNIIF